MGLKVGDVILDSVHAANNRTGHAHRVIAIDPFAITVQSIVTGNILEMSLRYFDDTRYIVIICEPNDILKGLL